MNPSPISCNVSFLIEKSVASLHVQPRALTHRSDEVVVEEEVVQAPREKVEELLGGPVHQPLAHLRMQVSK